MANHSTSSGSTASYFHYGEVIPVMLCDCGHELSLLTCWNRNDPGQRFHKCPSTGWYDSPMCNNARRIISGLLYKLNKCEDQKKENDKMMMAMKNEPIAAKKKVKDLQQQLVAQKKRYVLLKSVTISFACVAIAVGVMLLMKNNGA